MERSLIIAAVCVSCAWIIAVGIFTWAWKDAKNADRTITVTGSSKKNIVSDLGVLRGSIAVEAPTADAAYRELVRQRPIFLSYLNTQGFPEDRVRSYPITNVPVYQYNENGVRTSVRAYSYAQRFEVQSSDVQRIAKLALAIPSVIEQGVFFTLEPPEFYYTKLAEMKIEIQADAAKDAKIRAERIARSTDRSLGPLRDARMGVLQITPKNSNEISDYGINDVSSIEKEITAVVNASFQIY